jgi:hypothetical protein
MYLVEAESTFRKPTITRPTAKWSTPRVTPVPPLLWGQASLLAYAVEARKPGGDCQIITSFGSAYPNPKAAAELWARRWRSSEHLVNRANTPPAERGCLDVLDVRVVARAEPERPCVRSTFKPQRWPSFPYLSREALEWRADAVSKKWRDKVRARWEAANSPTDTVFYGMPSQETNKCSWDDARVAGKTYCPHQSPDWALFAGFIPYEREPEVPPSPAMAMEEDRRSALLANRDRLRAEREARGVKLVRWQGKASVATEKKGLPLAEWDNLARRARVDDGAYNDIVAAAFPIAQKLAQRLLPDREVGGKAHADELRDELVHVGIFGTAIGDRTTGIWLAIDQWDPAKGGSFRAFMRRAMRQRMIDHWRKHLKHRRKHEWADEPLRDGSGDE